jgi:hypothetical protein
MTAPEPPAQEVTEDPVPQVVAAYAAYLRSRTGLVPEVTVEGEDAHLTLTVEATAKTFVLTFNGHKKDWLPRSAEIRQGETTIKTYTRGQFADAVAALFRRDEEPRHA